MSGVIPSYVYWFVLLLLIYMNFSLGLIVVCAKETDWHAVFARYINHVICYRLKNVLNNSRMSPLIRILLHSPALLSRKSDNLAFFLFKLSERVHISWELLIIIIIRRRWRRRRRRRNCITHSLFEDRLTGGQLLIRSLYIRKRMIVTVLVAYIAICWPGWRDSKMC